MRRSKRTVIIAWAAVVLWMSFIFTMSAQPAEESKQTSGGVAELILRVVVPDFDGLSREEQAEMIESIQYFVRKGAHFCGYALLGILLFTAFSCHFEKLTLLVILSLSASALYAASDELHQRFIPGRSGEFADVLLDSTGALLGIMICLAVTFLWRRKKAGNKPIFARV